MNEEFQLSCPLPLRDYPSVQLAHGGGGTLMRQLIEKLFLPAFRNPALEALSDSAELTAPGPRLAFTTDSYVVRPLFFPGGDIGTLAVYGTVNDLAMSGARPLALSAAFILEEGFPMETLWRVVQSMRRAADAVGVPIVTGDTKVVDKGKGDGLFINTAGVGLIEHSLRIGPASVQPGDAVVLSGDIGRHGIAVLAARENLQFETTIESDCAPLWKPVQTLLRDGLSVHCLRDLTRGGLASAAAEIAQAASVHVRLWEAALPVRGEGHAACEILGFDPLHVANEGRFVAFVPPEQADRAVQILRESGTAPEAAVVGHVEPTPPGMVSLQTRVGGARLVDLLSGDPLPRIC